MYDCYKFGKKEAGPVGHPSESWPPQWTMCFFRVFQPVSNGFAAPLSLVCKPTATGFEAKKPSFFSGVGFREQEKPLYRE